MCVLSVSICVVCVCMCVACVRCVCMFVCGLCNIPMSLAKHYLALFM